MNLRNATSAVGCRVLLHLGLSLLALLLIAGCSARQAELAQRLDSSDAELRADQEALRKELASIHRRLQLQADRLRRAEGELVRLRAEMLASGERSGSLSRRPSGTRETTPSVTAPFDAASAYEIGRAKYGDREYDAALVAFSRILTQAPQSKEADNAQYWIGECHYGLGRFREALLAFEKVLAYAQTEKDDDAQLKIARCHLSLGQREKAISAFRHLIETYPDSEYVSAADRELRYLEGP